MGKLIDADRLKAHYCWWQDENKEVFDQIIDLQPGVDPVGHGHWTCKYIKAMDSADDISHLYMRCSRCDAHIELKGVPEIKYVTFKYCPNCGAKMDEKEGYEVKDGVRIVI